MDFKILENLLQETIDREPERPSPPAYSKEDYGQSWSSQEWKSGAAAHDRSGKPEKTSWDMMQQVAPHREEPLLGRNAHSARYGELIHDRTGKPVSVHQQEQAYFENFIMGSDAAEFVNKVKDQVRNRQKRMSSIAESCDEHSIIWGMFMATTLNAATFMGKNFSTIQSVVKNHESLTLKQMFNDISCDRKGNKEECLANAGVVKVLARRFGVGQWSFVGPGSEKKWYSAQHSPQRAWDNIAEEMLLEFAESRHPTFRATTPLSTVFSRAKDMENCRYTSLQMN